MRYPNLRYGNPNEFAHYVQGIPLPEVAKRLRRDVRTVRDWLSGAKKIPYWVPELVRLQHMEHQNRLYEMNMRPTMLRLGIVTKTATIYEFPRVESPSVECVDTDTLPLFPMACSS